MDEKMVKTYLKEEEFLEDFYEFAAAAARALDYEWHPNTGCNDSVRRNRDYFLSTGELCELTFDSGIVYHTGNSFSSVVIILKSATRFVEIRVKRVAGKLVAEKIVDRPS